MTIEQMCRDLLDAASKDGVTIGDDPQELSAGDIVGMANLLQSILQRLDDRWRTAVGHDLATAEELAAAESRAVEDVSRRLRQAALTNSLKAGAR